jgi:predicted Zn-dependent protease
MFQSMQRISATDAAKVRARKVVVVTTKAGDTLQSLADRMAYSDAPMERFLVLNGLTANSRITAGQKVKLVTF